MSHKKYITVKMEILEFDEEDIISTSDESEEYDDTHDGGETPYDPNEE